ncbi:hypothetical protein NGB36_11040 [Streptomyces sp. RB6PN25]|uniref:Uncharacterized protein n=1 Tax=Streptomyces humicola TaxID=2953240 RepID=A0ABT1PTX1_9ACTN|nr:hypothetical protein [Streptomyces humicola]MCQ4081123.1 hypothetical protein [Streptomyces humicola]
MITLRHPAVEGALAEGRQDWVPLSFLAGMVEEDTPRWKSEKRHPSEEEIKAETIAVCDFLLREGLMRVGELSNSTEDPGDFLPWVGDIRGRISRDWDFLMSREHFEPCWLEITERGRHEAEKIPPLSPEEREP